jgi:hypothetical protein
MPGEMRITVSLTQVSCGTELNIVQEGIPAMISTEMCYLGWQESPGRSNSIFRVTSREAKCLIFRGVHHVVVRECSQFLSTNFRTRPP